MAAQQACMAADVPALGAVTAVLHGARGPVDVAVVRDAGGGLHAIGELCTHAEVSLADGEVTDGSIECWLHGSAFDLHTGEPLSPPATHPVAVYPLTVEAGRVLVDVDAPTNAERT